MFKTTDTPTRLTIKMTEHDVACAIRHYIKKEYPEITEDYLISPILPKSFIIVKCYHQSTTVEEG